MKDFPILFPRIVLLLVVVAMLSSLSCEESLPTYVAPSQVLTASVEKAEQLSDRIAPPGRQMMRIKIVVENVYDEVFYDTVNIKGTMTITWLRKAERSRTITVDEKDFLDRDLIKNRKMMLLPGQKVGLQLFWNFKGDDSTYFPEEMVYARAEPRNCGGISGGTIICSNAEDMLVEGTLSIFKDLPPVSVEAYTFFAIGRMIVIGGP